MSAEMRGPEVEAPLDRRALGGASDALAWQRSEAWLEVVRALDEVAPFWRLEDGEGVERACATIRHLVRSAQ